MPPPSILGFVAHTVPVATTQLWVTVRTAIDTCLSVDGCDPIKLYLQKRGPRRMAITG